MSEQLSLVPVPSGARRRAARAPRADVPLTERAPVARVLVDTPLAHLDRPFEYVVPAELDGAARPGVRVRVRFAGRDHDGMLLARSEEAEHAGRLSPLRSVVSPEPVLTPAVAAELRLVADHLGGTAADVLRLAVPPRHARAERSVAGGPEDPASVPDASAAAALVRTPVVLPGDRPVIDPETGAWAAYPAGAALLRRIAAGEAPAASWLALPSAPAGQDWPDTVAETVRVAHAAGRGSVVVVPDHRDVDRVLRVLITVLGEEQVVRLTADLGPEARYRAFLRVLRGHARVVVGTRSAAFAPVRDLGLLVCWDEGDDLHQEPRAPYPHVRDVLAIRAGQEGAALLLGGFTRSVPVQLWVEEGRLAPVAALPARVRAEAPAVLVAGEGWQEARDEGARTARIPSLAWRTLKEGLGRGPVLVQVPRQGYVVALACQDCRAPLRCGTCGGPVGAVDPGRAARCRWCEQVVPAEQRCAHCGSRRRRATGMGERRTAEELGRAFPGVLVLSSGGEHVLTEVGPEPALVVATPGAEPWCPSGYAAVALLDGWRLLERASLDAPVEALRRWCRAAALVVGGDRASRVVLCGVPPHGGLPAVEALVRWDPARLAGSELAERATLGLPPARRLASVSGPSAAATEVAQALVRDGHELLGVSGDRRPAEDEGTVVATVREGERATATLARTVQAVRAGRSARKAKEVVRIVLDVGDGLG